MPPFTDLSLQKLKTANLGNIATGLGNAISNLHQQAMDIVYKMPPTDLSLQSLKTANFSNIAAGLGNVISNLQQQAMDVVMMNAKDLLDFFKEPSESGFEAINTSNV